MSELIGPRVTIRESCFDCKYCRSESYKCQKDSGFDIYCDHPEMKGEMIGDTDWSTPEWCPVRNESPDPEKQAMRDALEMVKRNLDNHPPVVTDRTNVKVREALSNSKGGE